MIFRPHDGLARRNQIFILPSQGSDWLETLPIPADHRHRFRRILIHSRQPHFDAGPVFDRRGQQQSLSPCWMASQACADGRPLPIVWFAN